MSFGLTLFTLFHVVISLIGIASGFRVVFGLLAAQRLDGWTGLFLASTVATSVTGFLFPFHHLLPSHIVGLISLVVLIVAYIARYAKRMVGGWRWIYVVSAVLALYFNVFVLIVQAFRKVPFLTTLAPTQSEPPFQIVQGVVLVLFVVAGVLAVKRFRIPPSEPAIA
jgi:hypothetical protein